MNDGSWKGDGLNPSNGSKTTAASTKKYKLVSSIFAEATVIDGLTIKSQFNVDYTHTTGFGSSTPGAMPRTSAKVAPSA